MTASKDYYTSVDPGTATLDTLVKFKSKYGFGTDPNIPNTSGGEIVASYANSGDLGFGRDMHCRKKANGDVACYVTNYGTGYSSVPPGGGTDDHDDANAAASSTDGSGVSRVGVGSSLVGGNGGDGIRADQQCRPARGQVLRL